MHRSSSAQDQGTACVWISIRAWMHWMPPGCFNSPTWWRRIFSAP